MTSSSPRVPPRQLSPWGHLVAWLLLWVVNSVFVMATFPRVTPGSIRIRQLLFDAGYMLAAGLVVEGAVESWNRWGPQKRVWGYLALGLVSISVCALLVRDDFEGFVSRLRGPHLFWLALFVVLAGISVPIAALVANFATRSPWLAVPLSAVALLVAINNEFLFPQDYFGLHFLAAGLAATVLGITIGAALARFRDFVQLRSTWIVGVHVLRGALAICASVALFSWPGSSVVIELLKVPGSVLAPFLRFTREGKPPLPEISPASAPWFANRSQVQEIPPSPSPLVDNPIVILFVVDCMRADVLENVKGEVSLPTIFSLRDASVNFTQARTMAPATTQSVAAMMASKAYSQMYWTSIQNRKGEGRVFPAEDTSKRFPEVLTAAGVATILSTPLSGLTNKMGVLRGVSEEYIHPRLTAPAAVLAAGIIKRLKTTSAQPAFLYVHVTDAHAPWPHSGPSGTPWQKYLRGLEKIDAALASIDRALQDAGLAERTVLILTADHGEAFGEHGDRFHGHSLYDEVLRVPLVVRVPGLLPRKVDDLVSLGDLAPTILDLFRLPTPGAFTGQSLVGLLRGDTTPLVRPVVAESTRYKRTMIFPNGMKVIEDRRIGIFELFDLKKDPKELLNLLDGDTLTPSNCPELGFLRAFFEAHEFKRPGYTLPYQR